MISNNLRRLSVGAVSRIAQSRVRHGRHCRIVE
jgi:hypothetical protein